MLIFIVFKTVQSSSNFGDVSRYIYDLPPKSQPFFPPLSLRAPPLPTYFPEPETYYNEPAPVYGPPQASYPVPNLESLYNEPQIYKQHNVETSYTYKLYNPPQNKIPNYSQQPFEPPILDLPVFPTPIYGIPTVNSYTPEELYPEFDLPYY